MSPQIEASVLVEIIDSEEDICTVELAISLSMSRSFDALVLGASGWSPYSSSKLVANAHSPSELVLEVEGNPGVAG